MTAVGSERRGALRQITLRRYLQFAGITTLTALAYAVPTVFGSNDFRMVSYNQVLALLLVVIGLGIAVGHAGQYIIGISAIFAAGAYSAALVAEHFPTHTGLLLMCAVGAASGGAAGLVMGSPSLRVAGFYLGLVSLFAALVVPAVAEKWDFVGGSLGIPLFTVLDFAPALTGYKLYVICLTTVLVAAVFSWALMHSRVGQQFAALNSSEQLATSMGITVYRTKLLAIFIASVLAGVGGGMYAYTQQLMAPASSSPQLSIYLFVALIVGGASASFGPLVGGTLVLAFNQFFTAWSSYNGLIFGGLLIVFAVFLPDGVVLQLSRLRFWNRTPCHVDSASATEPAASTPTESFRTASAHSAIERRDDSHATLRVLSARRSFGGVRAVDGVDLELPRGSIHGLIGSNGSGKTTLLNLISGFYPLDDGQVMVGDARLDRISPSARARFGIARTFQTPKLIVDATALANVVPMVEMRLRCTAWESVLRLPRGVRTHRQALTEARRALKALGVEHIQDMPAGTLPHGTQRMVELARVLAARPKFVLVDEPAAGLSPRELDLLIAALKRLAAAGTGVLLIEHNVPMVLEIADTVTVMHQGSCLFRGTPNELRSDTQVADAFLGLSDPLDTAS